MSGSAKLTRDEIVRLSKDHSIFSWSAQRGLDPIVMDRAEGVYFWDIDGKRYLDFNSQLMSVNIGHGDRRVADAIAEQAHRLAYAAPSFATEIRARLSAKLTELTPGDLNHFFFTTGGSEANENALRMARAVTGRPKIMSRYRSYHGATIGSLSASGDPRRWLAEPTVPGIVRVVDPQHHGTSDPDGVAVHLEYLDEVIRYEGPDTIAAFILETVVGSNGILIPPDGYLQGIRELCSKYGILMICDEVMAGFGRTGRWFAVEHWGVVPDIMTMAKGLTSAYAPLGAVAISDAVASHFQDRVFNGGLTYSAHPISCAAALAVIGVIEEDRLLQHVDALGPLLADLLRGLQSRHPSVGDVRSLGLFGVIELVRTRDPWVPLAPFNGRSPETVALDRQLKSEGLYTSLRWNFLFTNPPLSITEQELRDGFAIIDSALAAADDI